MTNTNLTMEDRISMESQKLLKENIFSVSSSCKHLLFHSKFEDIVNSFNAINIKTLKYSNTRQNRVGFWHISKMRKSALEKQKMELFHLMMSEANKEGEILQVCSERRVESMRQERQSKIVMKIISPSYESARNISIFLAHDSKALCRFVLSQIQLGPTQLLPSPSTFKQNKMKKSCTQQWMKS